jgi:hypothetical protein
MSYTATIPYKFKPHDWVWVVTTTRERVCSTCKNTSLSDYHVRHGFVTDVYLSHHIRVTEGSVVTYTVQLTDGVDNDPPWSIEECCEAHEGNMFVTQAEADAKATNARSLSLLCEKVASL